MRETETVLSVIRDHPKTITGEPVTGKLVRRVREGADGKGLALRAPHRRPTSLEAAGAGNGADLAKVTGVVQPNGKPAEHEGPRPYRQRATAPAPDPTRGVAGWLAGPRVLIFGVLVDVVVKVRSGSGSGSRIGWAPDSRGPDGFLGRGQGTW
jgi:hypothetical protein